MHVEKILFTPWGEERPTRTRHLLGIWLQLGICMTHQDQRMGCGNASPVPLEPGEAEELNIGGISA